MNSRDQSPVAEAPSPIEPELATDRPAQPDVPTGPRGAVPVEEPAVPAAGPGVEPPPETVTGFLSARPARLGFESVLVRLIATAGIIGIGTAIGAALVAEDVAGWIAALSVSFVSVALAAVLWRSRRL